MNFILKVLIWLIVIIFTFHYLTKTYLNPYKLIMVFGKKGAGKTTFLTKVAINAIKKNPNRKVYSTIYIPGTIQIKPEDIGLYDFEPDSIVLIDEVGMIWDNREYKNFKPHTRDFFKLQRHYKLTVYLFSQSFDIDKKLRDLTDEMFLLTNRLRVWSFARRIDKRITISKQTDEEGNKQNSTLVEDYKFAPIIFPGNLLITFIPRWSVFFDSYEVVPKTAIPGVYHEMPEDKAPFINTKYANKDIRKRVRSRVYNDIKDTGCILLQKIKEVPSRVTTMLQNKKQHMSQMVGKAKTFSLQAQDSTRFLNNKLKNKRLQNLDDNEKALEEFVQSNQEKL